MRRPRDRGSVLPLVLVLIVVAGFIVVPVMTYTASVLRANSVVTNKTKQLEAAKGGLRAALGSPKNVFTTCAAADVDLDPQPTINGYTVDNQCWLVDDVGSIEALGGQIPFGSTSMQLRSSVPADFVVGTAGTSDPVSAAAVATDWWEANSSDLPLDSKIWVPNLPRQPTTVRDNTPFDMPAAFGCKVFFPGHYTEPAPLELNPAVMGTNHVYFASGVYYFEQPIIVSGDIDVVVGYGIEDFGDACADDLQVAANVQGDPGSFAIDGGGATWVFGGDARLAVDDASGSPRIRFNQRYAGSYELAALPYEGFDRGRRINIIAVNGDARVADADHDVLDVNLVRRSSLITSAGTVDDTDPTIVTSPATIEPIDAASTYRPSTIELTDAARRPQPPSNLTATTYRYDDGGPVGAILLTWDAVRGQDAGGALITGYDVTVSPSPAPPHDVVCPLEAQVTFDDAGTEKVSCLVQGLTIGTAYTVEVTATNTSPIDGASDPAGAVAQPIAGDDEIVPPSAPDAVLVEETSAAGEAKVSWTSPADDGGAPVTSYQVTATRVYIEPPANEPPTAASMSVPLQLSAVERSASFDVPASDPNGDSLTLALDTSSLPATGEVQFTPTGSGLAIDVVVQPTATAGSYTVPYTVTDPAGEAASGDITLEVVVGPTSPSAPVAPSIAAVPEVGTDLVVHVPAYDADVEPLTVTVGDATLDGTPLDPSMWSVPFAVSGLEVTINTIAPDGTYEIPYRVEDASGASTDGSITVTVSRSYESVGACAVDSAPPSPLPSVCTIGGLGALPAVDGPVRNLGYRFDVAAGNGVGTSAVVSTSEPYPMSFDGGGTDLEPFVPSFEPYEPTPIIDVVADGPGVATVSVPGYVSVPMSRISISNPSGDPVSMTGGVLAGTFDVPDTWTVDGVVGGTPIGFWDQVILQRTVRIVTTAGTARSVAIVQVNRDNDLYGVNSWTVQ